MADLEIYSFKSTSYPACYSHDANLSLAGSKGLSWDILSLFLWLTAVSFPFCLVCFSGELYLLWSSLSLLKIITN